MKLLRTRLESHARHELPVEHHFLLIKGALSLLVALVQQHHRAEGRLVGLQSLFSDACKYQHLLDHVIPECNWGRDVEDMHKFHHIWRWKAIKCQIWDSCHNESQVKYYDDLECSHIVIIVARGNYVRFKSLINRYQIRKYWVRAGLRTLKYLERVLLVVLVGAGLQDEIVKVHVGFDVEFFHFVQHDKTPIHVVARTFCFCTRLRTPLGRSYSALI